MTAPAPVGPHSAPLSTGGGCLRAARLARGWTQSQLAIRARITRGTVARAEQGHAVTARIERRILHAFHLRESRRGELFA